MVSLFLVEDEKFSRDSIRDNINWEGIGISFIGDASDGEIALPFILEHPPDILLTDIMMPFMDGIELSKIVKKKFPNTKVIFISGFDDFKYAQKGISIGISDYILKPASSQNIIDSVCKVRDEVLKERGEQASLVQQEKENSILKQDLFFEKILSETNLRTSDILSEADRLGIPIQSRFYQVIIAEMQEGTSQELISEISDLSVLYFFQYTHKLVLIIKGETKDEIIQTEKQVETLALKEKKHIFKGVLVERIVDIQKSYAVASSAKKLTKLEVQPNQESLEVVQLDDLDIKIKDFLSVGQLSSVNAFWNEQYPMIEQGGKSFLFGSYLYAKLYFIIQQVAIDLGIDLPENFISQSQLEQLVIHHNSPEEFLSFAKKTFEDFIGLRNEKGENPYGSIENQTMNYIKKNYMNQELSLSLIARHIHVTPNYLSAIFKEKTGKNVTEYLTDVRIKKAKELLKNTSMKAFEIAFQIGYNSTSHFSTIFKKQVGISPSQYRKKERYQHEEDTYNTV